MSERTSDTDEVVCACFTGWQQHLTVETGAINADPKERGSTGVKENLHCVTV